MPVIKSAIKKLRQDKKKTVVNMKVKNELAGAVKLIKKGSKKISLNDVYSKIDKAAKSGIIHKNKAARLKSTLSKKAPKPTSLKPKPAPKKSPAKKRTKAAK